MTFYTRGGTNVKRKVRSGACPATRLLGSKLFDCCSRHQCAVVSGAPATTRLTPREAPGWQALRSRARRGNSRIPGGTKPGPSSLLEIGFGDASARAPLFALLAIFKIPLKEGLARIPQIADEKRDP